MSSESFADRAHYEQAGFGKAPEELEGLLARASRRMRAEARQAGVDLDAQITEGLLEAADAADVCCAIAKRAAPKGGAIADAVTSLQNTAGPFQQTQQFANPMGDVYLTRGELKTLGLTSTKAWTVDLLGGIGG